MERDLFLVVLALLTAVSGVALFVMTLRRRRLAADARRKADHEAETPEAMNEEHEPTDERRRLIDDYAIPVSFDGAREESKDDELDISKICPRCGRRYGSHHRICERDNSELAALN